MNGIKIDWIWIAVVAVVAIVSARVRLWHRQKGEEAVRVWAEEQGFTLLESVRRLFVPHWLFTVGKRYQFFRVRVRDKQGSVRQGWLRCSVWGFCDPKDADIEVIWDGK